jgi:type VI protein secretion system component VasF
MPKTLEDQLSDLVEAVKALPDETQEALVEEFRDRLADFTHADLSDAQRQDVERRLANPRYAEPEKVREFFARYGVTET